MPDKSDFQSALDSLNTSLRALKQRVDNLDELRREGAELTEKLFEHSGFTERSWGLVKSIQGEVEGSAADIVKRALVLYLQAVRAEKENQRIAFLDEHDNIVNELRDVTGHPLASRSAAAG